MGALGAVRATQTRPKKAECRGCGERGRREKSLGRARLRGNRAVSAFPHNGESSACSNDPVVPGQACKDLQSPSRALILTHTRVISRRPADEGVRDHFWKQPPQLRRQRACRRAQEHLPAHMGSAQPWDTSPLLSGETICSTVTGTGWDTVTQKHSGGFLGFAGATHISNSKPFCVIVQW